MTDVTKRYRHGDVVLQGIVALPGNCMREAVKPLAVGEATGHAHRFAAGEVRFWRRGATRYVEVLTPSQLTHEEHKTLTIAPGVYEQLGEREFDYAKIKKEADYVRARAYTRPVRD